MKRYPQLMIVLLALLLFVRCGKEEANLSPASQAAGKPEKLSSVHIGASQRSFAASSLLTGREWNDLNNWDRWATQIKSAEALSIQEKWKFSLQNRYTVLLTDSLGKHIPDASISLETLQGRLLAQSRTDNTGHSELFPLSVTKTGELRLKIVYDNQVFYLGNLDVEQGRIKKQLNVRRKIAANQDIVFAVSSSGTHSGTLQYLHKELEPMIRQLKKSAATGMTTRLGSILYDGHAGKPLTGNVSLMADLNKAIVQIKEQSAGKSSATAGADVTLEEAIYRQPWAKESTSRILFLFVDTPPEYTSAAVQRIDRAIHEAARQGIRIVPVVTGSISKETEFLLRSMAIRTNGTYVYTLTQRTSHTQPVWESMTDAEEALSDIVVRLIAEYTHIE